MARPDGALVLLYQSFAKELIRQRETFVKALAGKYFLDASTPAVERGGAWYCLIRLHDAWAHFCREALVLCAEGNVRTKSGTLLTRSTHLQPSDQVMKVLKPLWRPTGLFWGKQGPALELPSNAITAAQLLQISNYRQFAAGIGAAANAPTELKAVRNFLAHRHFDTALHPDVTSLRQRINAISPSIQVGSLPARIGSSGGVSVFEDWCIELNDLARAAID